MGQITLPPGKQFQFKLAPKYQNAKGELKDGQVDGIPVYTNSNQNAVDLFVNPDGMGGVVQHLDGGDAQITVTADADLGEGVKEITGLLEIKALPFEATILDLEPGPLEDIPQG